MTPGPRYSRLWWATAPVLTLLVGAVLVMGTLRVPYVTLRPGGARSVEPLVTVEQVPGGPEVDTEPASDNLLYVTVSSSVEPSGFYALMGFFDDKVQVEPSAPFLGTQTSSENRSLNLAMMTDSQEKAKKVALEKLGFEVIATPAGVFFEDVDPDFPASSVLKPGMTVVAADGEPVEVAQDLLDAIASHAPGDTMDLEVVPLGSTEPESVVATLGSRPSDPEAPVLGVSVANRATYEFPVDITIDTGKVGGPSAGLSFTLAILDRMTPGSLTGDERVAVTGTIELDGSVGPVGGVDHKTEAAVREGAVLFLVPPDEYDQAVEAADGRIQIESVASVDEALAALERVGGSGLPAPS